MATRLYEYAIIKEAKTDKDGEVTEKATLLDRGDVLAVSDSDATLLAGRKIPENELENLERITLAVRPF